MHPSVMWFVEREVSRHQLADLDVLEVGALNVNGTVRGLFTGPYLGTDMRPGAGVDHVCDAHDLGFGADFDLIISTEMLEHDSAPWLSLARMRMCVREGGHLLLTARGYDERGCFPVHAYPDDLWRFSVEGIRALLAQTGWTAVTVETDPEAPGVFAHATT